MPFLALQRGILGFSILNRSPYSTGSFYGQPRKTCRTYVPIQYNYSHRVIMSAVAQPFKPQIYMQFTTR